MVIKLQLDKLFILVGCFICILAIIESPSILLQHTITDSTSNQTVLIIDAGHGGDDGGAVGIDGTTESEINILIAQKVNLLAKLCGISTVMTRDSEEIDYPPEANSISKRKLADQNARLRLIRDYPHGILYSIHQNAYPNESVSGIQVFYGHNVSSQKLAVLLQNRFNEAITTHTRRVAAEISEQIYLMKHCDCTAVLIECGFLSNKNECKTLQDQAYQKRLSIVMLGAYLEYLNDKDQ